jgi:hypothetical protein
MMHRSAVLVVVLLVLVTAADAQEAPTYTYGNRPIDLLPKSETARAEEQRGWGESEAPRTLEVGLHTKDHFRIGRNGLERLCVIEARRPEAQRGPLKLFLLIASGAVLWQASGDWIGTNQRMRPYWLPVRAGEATSLVLEGTAERFVLPIDSLAENAPEAMMTLTEGPRGALAVDVGCALLPANEIVQQIGDPMSLHVRLLRRPPGGVQIVLRDAAAPAEAAPLVTRAMPAPQFDLYAVFRAAASDLGINAAMVGKPRRITAEVVASGRVLARQEFVIHPVDIHNRSFEQFGARAADLRYTLPIKDGDRERTWEELWGKSGKRDVVVSFDNSAARLVFWRGASYVPCWALPEGWLTYEWLEAEPYFFGADDCVEPLQDRDCKYSQVEIISSTPARAVVVWRYALTDFQGNIIQDEHAEETWTIYPDGVGTRLLRGFYKTGWHENQEFIVINRPGQRASEALDPQALTFYNLQGDKQAPVWPKPGFSLQGWPQVITVVNLGAGPRPFMVTLDAPQQVKVWANPFLDKPDLFNSYPHWPVTRGMRTSWLSDPADFARPTHSNLVNLVNRPYHETDDEKDFLWLIGVARSDDVALAAAAAWLQPGSVRAGKGVSRGEYNQVERAYVVQAEAGARQCSFVLAPPEGGALTSPAVIIKGWVGAAKVTVPGAGQVLQGQEEGQLVVVAEGHFDRPVQITVERVGRF